MVTPPLRAGERVEVSLIPDVELSGRERALYGNRIAGNRIVRELTVEPPTDARPY